MELSQLGKAPVSASALDSTAWCVPRSSVLQEIKLTRAVRTTLPAYLISPVEIPLAGSAPFGANTPRTSGETRPNHLLSKCQMSLWSASPSFAMEVGAAWNAAVEIEASPQIRAFKSWS